MTDRVKWFEREFDFSFTQNIFPSLIERLMGTPMRLMNKMTLIPPEYLVVRLDNKWSVLENIGHLIDLEPLWAGRLDDILNHKRELRPADLTNRKTDEAKYNNFNVDDLVEEFTNLRGKTVSKLETLTRKEIYQSALHPRLKTPMRTMDLFLFVAEHDDHHLARITEITRLLNKK